MVAATTILLIRHGARYDYEIGKDAWKARCAGSTALTASDPPLSALGHEQARGLAAHLAKQGDIDAILVSPYLRALQTAQPLAHTAGLPLLVDFACAEAHQRPAALPPLDARLPYFPEIDTSYEPIMRGVVTGGPDGLEPGVEPRLEHMRRMLHLARALPTRPSAGRASGRTVAIFTHAASVALVAALAGPSSLAAAGKLAPCGVCKLLLDEDGTVTVAARGDDISAYARSSAETAAWGFADSTQPLEAAEQMWAEALRLGPTDLSALRVDARPAQDASSGGGGVDDSYEPESLVR
jgi:broad specificity phosphatase PhoE